MLLCNPSSALRGYLFDYITCANYTTEVWGWVAFSVGVQALPAAIFMVAGAYQMAIWALQKHRRLNKVSLEIRKDLSGNRRTFQGPYDLACKLCT